MHTHKRVSLNVLGSVGKFLPLTLILKFCRRVSGTSGALAVWKSSPSDDCCSSPLMQHCCEHRREQKTLQTVIKTVEQVLSGKKNEEQKTLKITSSKVKIESDLQFLFRN